ncbi:ribosomal-protein-alanine N-acetyltransferase [Marinomonas rhizomae]|uniref:Ribosomal-protein-alanine N-acetyltransferase n=1 Tax=Marinomonas rhizomae TaxID=491948 RepID=A0A366JBR6_9GAMM|nr:ribosomal protein S18-alanine N-acetyltransferase [Marinomonas rhizomae]RBP83695.1 ribosomal-protein-alanine N-acetyltransferase [Marinomonas rhizomae]RNF69686.1 ribosomal-protein-alanine N-acetyltransferase [Marinomonas rhizomae]
MIPSVSFRLASLSDLTAIIQLDALSNPHPWGENLISDALQTRKNWVVELGDVTQKSIVGWLTASVVLDQSELELIVIDPSVRRQGLARQLMIAWSEAVAQQDVSELLLEVRESNLGAISLYKSLGFEQVGRRKNYYQIEKKGQAEQGREAACLFTLKIERL